MKVDYTTAEPTSSEKEEKISEQTFIRSFFIRKSADKTKVFLPDFLLEILLYNAVHRSREKIGN